MSHSTAGNERRLNQLLAREIASVVVPDLLPLVRATIPLTATEYRAFEEEFTAKAGQRLLTILGDCEVRRVIGQPWLAEFGDHIQDEREMLIGEYVLEQLRQALLPTLARAAATQLALLQLTSGEDATRASARRRNVHCWTDLSRSELHLAAGWIHRVSHMSLPTHRRRRREEPFDLRRHQWCQGDVATALHVGWDMTYAEVWEAVYLGGDAKDPADAVHHRVKRFQSRRAEIVSALVEGKAGRYCPQVVWDCLNGGSRREGKESDEVSLLWALYGVYVELQ